MNTCLDLQTTMLSDLVRNYDLYFMKTYKTDYKTNGP